MAKREWNDHQRQGIEARGGSLLLSAAAGSGKTAVLVERVLRRITDPKEAVDIDRLLIVTFTRAAAAEMRQRLSAALAELSATDPENLLYQKQQMLLPQASISTVHSFCTSLLREQATVAGLPVGFKVAEDAQALLLASQALDEVLEESYRRRDPAFLALATQLNSQRNDRGLRQAVEQTYTFMQAQPHPERWLQEQVDAYTRVQPLENSRWFSFACGELEILLDGCRLLARRALASAQEGGLEGYLPALMLDVQRIEGLCPLPQGICYDDLHRQLEGLKPERLPPVKTQDAAQMEAKEQVKSLRDSLRKKLERVRGLLPCDEAACREDLAAMAPLVGALGDLVTAYTQRFNQLKRRQKLLDYNDLEHECLTLLLDEGDNPTPLAEELSARYEEIMVDEYQDTNAAQDTLFRAISRGENNLFMVGDVKQSIYGFRQAMPTIFTGRRAAYTPYEEATPVFPAALSLERNYRSRYEVTETVNFLFRQVMHRRLGGVEYGEGEALVCAASYPEGAGYETEWLLCDRTEEGACLPQDVLEARLIGRRIQELQGSLLIGQENRRPLEYGDICILFRARTHMAAYAKELNRMGIPTATEENGSFLSTPEIRCALSLLRVIDNPLREVELTAVMLSPVYGFTADECALVRLKGGAGRKAPPLYSALSLVGSSDNTAATPTLYEKCQRLLSDLSRYRTLAVSLPADRLLERLLRDTGLEAVFAARPGGGQRVANLHQLDRVARGFEQGGFRGLSAFVRYVDLLEEQGRDLPAGSAQRQDGVRLMTMHASKGLEFPVVFLARLGGLSGGDKTAKLLFHHEAGIGMQLWDEQDLDKHTTLPFCGVRSARRQDEQAEELRVWYVAMTRAREKLILVYTAKNLHKKLASLAAELPQEDRLMTDTVLCATAPGDWLLAAALRHPDFAAARGARSGLLACDCRWQVEERTDSLLEDENTVADAAVTISPDEALASLLRERLAFQYPYAPLAAVPAMLAASQLSHEAMSRDHVAAARPAFLQREGLTPAGRGTAHHTFMQFADFAAACEDLEGEITRLLAAGFITDQQAAALDRDRLSAFLQSPLYARMAASPDCRREYHFILTVPAGSLTQLPPEMAAEPVVVQGIADCVFREGDRLVLVDYKTDRVKTPEELVERYRSQMSFYKQAMETLLGLPVSQVLLYSFSLGGTIEVK